MREEAAGGGGSRRRPEHEAAISTCALALLATSRSTCAIRAEPRARLAPLTIKTEHRVDSLRCQLVHLEKAVDSSSMARHRMLDFRVDGRDNVDTGEGLTDDRREARGRRRIRRACTYHDARKANAAAVDKTAAGIVREQKLADGFRHTISRVWCGARRVADDIIAGDEIGRRARSQRCARRRVDEARPGRTAVPSRLQHLQGAAHIHAHAKIKVSLACAAHDGPEVEDGDRATVGAGEERAAIAFVREVAGDDLRLCGQLYYMTRDESQLH